MERISCFDLVDTGRCHELRFYLSLERNKHMFIKKKIKLSNKFTSIVFSLTVLMLCLNGLYELTGYAAPVNLTPQVTFSTASSSGTLSMSEVRDQLAAAGLNYAKDPFTTEFDNSVTVIGEGAFASCEGLTSITIPESVTRIGRSAFASCKKLISVTILKNVVLIDPLAFKQCSALTSVTIPDGVYGIGSYAFEACTSLTSITIPESVTIIGSDAFYRCTKLADVYFLRPTPPEIGTDAFLYLPSNATGYIQINAIGYAASYDDLTIARKPIIFSTANSSGALSKSEVRKQLADAGLNYDTDPFTAEFDNSVTKIDNLAFSYCAGLGSVNIRDGITSLGPCAFWGCLGLKNAEIPESVTAMDNEVFSNCINLKSVTIPAGVPSIGRYAFAGCNKLTNITIPDSITNISEYAFQNCTNLKDVYFLPETAPAIGVYAFYSLPSGAKGYISANATGYAASYNALTIVGNPLLFTVTYNYSENGGDSATKTTDSLKAGESVDLTPTAAKQGGWTFVGWNTDKNANSALSSLKMEPNDITLHAIYKEPPFFTVTYNYSENGGDSATKTTDSLKAGEPVDLTPTAAKQGGWTFVGWNTDKNANSALSSLKMKPNDMTLYAIYKDNVFFANTSNYDKYKLEKEEIPISSGAHEVLYKIKITPDPGPTQIDIKIIVPHYFTQNTPDDIKAVSDEDVTDDPKELDPSRYKVQDQMIFVTIFDIKSGRLYGLIDESRDKSTNNAVTTSTENENTPKVILGDADMDGKVTVKDATKVQHHVAKMLRLTGTASKTADVDEDGKITIKDVMLIRKYVAKIGKSKVGEWINVSQQ